MQGQPYQNNQYQGQYPQQQNQYAQQQPQQYQMQQFNQMPNQQQPQFQQNFNQQNMQQIQQLLPGQIISGIQKLEKTFGIYIEKKLNTTELATLGACEQQNVYYVYSMGQNGEIQYNDPLFKIKEKSNCLARQCLPGDVRPFNLEMTDALTKQLLLVGQRECQCTCLCFNRPELKVMDNQGKLKGLIKDPFTCCTLETPVYDSNRVLKYKILGDACSCAFCFRFAFPCQACQQFSFQVQDGNDNKITSVERTFSGCTCSQYYNRLSIKFPVNTFYEDKLLLIFTLVFIDFKYFEEGKKNEADGVDIV